ncbi:hypothetical protein JOF56_010824 [Kibdelosporangium banguiense]|uniref:IPT/TIG domain-containing protein n=1 Tax=Kibdelosporangium banguiense TaxID=1365924 RepID=A0ABS4U1A7_9PSEU|nr:hypothetical protein [Kibdelosporangium banguiense]MBP2330439.1 hypothetical protein [Kibdelosporangium banguiense]
MSRAMSGRAGLRGIVLVAALIAAPVLAAVPAVADGNHCTPSAANKGLADFHMSERDWIRTFEIVNIRAEVFVPTESFDSGHNPSESASTFRVAATRSDTVAVQKTEPGPFGFFGPLLASYFDGIIGALGRKTGKTTTSSTTTSSTITAEYPWPGRGRVSTANGVYVVDADVIMRVFYARNRDGHLACDLQGGPTAPIFQRVPTIVHGFGNQREYPVINRGGVVNALNYRQDDIHNGGIIAIFGEYFHERGTTDTVEITQGGRTWTRTAGSENWYNGDRQINLTLPGDMTPGEATIKVRAQEGQLSWPRQITVLP